MSNPAVRRALEQLHQRQQQQQPPDEDHGGQQQRRVPFLSDLDETASPATRHLAQEFGRLEKLVNTMTNQKENKTSSTTGKPNGAGKRASGPTKGARVIAISLNARGGALDAAAAAGLNECKEKPNKQSFQHAPSAMVKENRPTRQAQGEPPRRSNREENLQNGEQRGLAKWGNSRSRSRSRGGSLKKVTAQKTIPANQVRALSTLLTNQQYR